MADANTIETTFPYPASPDVARHQCTECGGWERSDKGLIRHSKRCDSKAQAAQTAAAPVTTDSELRTFARNVRTYSQTKGRNEDVLNAVRAGYLSVDDAMNTDD